MRSLLLALISIIIFYSNPSFALFRTFGFKSTRMSRIVAITGSNKGIGFHIALQLARSGKFTNVILACRDESRGIEAQKKIQNELEDGDCEISFEQLEIGNEDSHERFYHTLNEKYGGKLDVLVNNAAMAFKGADPTPFKQQCKPTLDINFRGTVDFTERILPLIRKGNDSRIVNVASMAGRLKQIKSDNLRNQFIDPNLTMEKLMTLVDQFENDVMSGNHVQKGWGNSNYGMSKLAVVAATKIWAREEEKNGIKVNCCCPGYCDTDMTSHKGPRPPSDGARNAVLPAVLESRKCPTGEFFADYQISNW